MAIKGLHNSALFRELCFVNGEWIAANNGQTIPVYNPYDQQQIGSIPLCGQEETRRAIESASDAWPSYAALSAKERSDLLFKWFDLIETNKEDLARIMTIEQGKPIVESRGEMDYANSFIRWFAEEARRVYGDVISSNKRNQRLIVIKQPVGVVAAITPWNFPAAMITRKIAPALAAGCTVVVKPDKATPFSALALVSLAKEAGFPKGVINMVTGDPEEIGGEMTSNELVRKISFTGSTPVGRLLMKQSAPTIKKISLELGGNAPFIVCDDADMDAAVTGCVASKFRNTGQTCVCANRIFVQEKIYDVFKNKLIEAVKKLKVGNGLDEDVQIGPLINQKALDKVSKHVADAVSRGASIAIGGRPDARGGLFYEPTVLTDVNTSMLLAREETFGPVAPLFRFSDDNEAIRLANDTEFGLASYFYSQDVNRIFNLAERLEYGMVGVNTGILSSEVAPFGGVKQSGIGREGSKYGMDEYVEIKYICLGGGEEMRK